VTVEVTAPVTGRVLAVADVSDPVFAQEIVGPGVAIVPSQDGEDTAVAPVDGTVVKIHPHAYVIATPQGPAVLVHLGVDTVTLRGSGFTVLGHDRQKVSVGDAMVTWNPADIRERGLDPVVPVIVMEAKGQTLTPVAQPGTRVRVGDPLLRIG